MKYDCFLADPEQLRPDMEVELVIRDLTPGRRKYDSRHVLLKVLLPNPEDRDSDELSIRQMNGKLHKNRWNIKVLKELGAYKTRG